eukprot:s2542_g4.t1
MKPPTIHQAAIDAAQNGLNPPYTESQSLQPNTAVVAIYRLTEQVDFFHHLLLRGLLLSTRDLLVNHGGPGTTAAVGFGTAWEWWAGCGLGLVLFSAGLAEQGLRSSGTGSAEAAGEGVFSSMFGQLRHALSLQPSEKPASAATSLYESLENHTENTSTGQVFTVTLNSELQEHRLLGPV